MFVAGVDGCRAGWVKGADGHFFCAFFRRLLARDLATVAFARFIVMRRKWGMAVVCHRSDAKATMWKLKLTHYPSFS